MLTDQEAEEIKRKLGEGWRRPILIFTNFRVVEDPDSETGYDVEPGPFQGWAQPPEW